MTTTTTHTLYFRSALPHGSASPDPRINQESAADAADRAANPAAYEPVTFDSAGHKGLTGFKRRPVTVEVEAATAPLATDASAEHAAYVAALLEGAQARAIKADFEAGGLSAIQPSNYTLDALAARWRAAQAAKPAAGGLPTVSDAALAKAQALFSAWYVVVAPKFAPRVADLFVKGWSYTSQAKALGEVTEVRHNNVVARVAQFTAAVEADATLADADKADILSACELAREMQTRFHGRTFASVASDEEM